MFEETESAEVDTQSDASTETSSESPSTDAQVEGGKEASSEQSTDSAPFHEHPRFKELVEQKNQALSAQKSLEQKLSQLEARIQQPQDSRQQAQAQAAKDELIDDLRKIDPRLADRLESFSKAFPSIEQLQQKLNHFEQQQTIQTALSHINQMHESNKVSPELKGMINNELDRLYMSGKLSLSNLQESYKNTHDTFKSWQENIKRETLKGYVPDKKADAIVPTSQPKGTPAKAAPKKPQWSKDPEVARQQVVSRYIKMKQAESDSSST